MTTIYKPFHIDPNTGYPTSIPDGAIINAGGVAQSIFSVGGKPVMLADGTAADGLGGLGHLNLQAAYDNTEDDDGHASIILTTGKDFIIYDDDNPNAFFRVDSETGKVTIAGDLVVGGQRHVVETQVVDADHYLLSPSSPDTTALKIEPDEGVSVTAPLVEVLLSHGGESAFTISALGGATLKDTIVDGHLTVNGTINNVDIVNLLARVNSHTSVDADKHQAKEINIWPGSLDQFGIYPAGTKTVQQVLEIISGSINIINSDVAELQTAVTDLQDQVQQNVSNIPHGYTHIQAGPEDVWIIQHGQNSMNFVYALFDDNGLQVIPDEFVMVSANEVRVIFGAPSAGRLNMMFYPWLDDPQGEPLA